jgi:hypothetical protein
MGVHQVHVIGPMCVVNHVTSEPANHRECAEYAAKVCPFLTRPRQKRDMKNLPEDTVVAGMPITRNPGAVCLYETKTVKPFRAGEGILFQLGDPVAIDWWANGRKATRAEVQDSIDSGYPLLMEQAKRDGPEAVSQLSRMKDAAMNLLPLYPLY